MERRRDRIVGELVAPRVPHRRVKRCSVGRLLGMVQAMSVEVLLCLLVAGGVFTSYTVVTSRQDRKRQTAAFLEFVVALTRGADGGGSVNDRARPSPPRRSG